jgi:hypothetical protein
MRAGSSTPQRSSRLFYAANSAGFGVHTVPGQLLHCMDAGALTLARFPGARPGSHQKTRRLLWTVPRARHLQVRRGARYHTGGFGAPGRLVNEPRGTRATDALLAVRQEGGGRRGGGAAETARSAEESVLRCAVRTMLHPHMMSIRHATNLGRVFGPRQLGFVPRSCGNAPIMRLRTEGSFSNSP